MMGSTRSIRMASPGTGASPKTTSISTVIGSISEAAAGQPGLRGAERSICQATGASYSSGPVRLMRWAAEHGGMGSLQQAVSGGQYSHPNGVFSRRRPTWSRRTQTKILQSIWARHARSPSSTITAASAPGATPSRSCPCRATATLQARGRMVRQRDHITRRRHVDVGRYHRRRRQRRRAASA